MKNNNDLICDNCGCLIETKENNEYLVKKKLKFSRIDFFDESKPIDVIDTCDCCYEKISRHLKRCALLDKVKELMIKRDINSPFFNIAFLKLLKEYEENIS